MVLNQFIQVFYKNETFGQQIIQTNMTCSVLSFFYSCVTTSYCLNQAAHLCWISIESPITGCGPHCQEVACLSMVRVACAQCTSLSHC